MSFLVSGFIADRGRHHRAVRSSEARPQHGQLLHQVQLSIRIGIYSFISIDTRLPYRSVIEGVASHALIFRSALLCAEEVVSDQWARV